MQNKRGSNKKKYSYTNATPFSAERHKSRHKNIFIARSLANGTRTRRRRRIPCAAVASKREKKGIGEEAREARHIMHVTALQNGGGRGIAARPEMRSGRSRALGSSRTARNSRAGNTGGRIKRVDGDCRKEVIIRLLRSRLHSTE